jgi:hypothetical protein
MLSMKIVSALLVATAIVWSVKAEDGEPSDSPITVTIQGSANFGAISGFLQTPTGGRPGSSSKQRPTFEELGINDAWFYDARLDLQWHRLRLYGGYQFVRLDGSATLGQPLVSRGVSFAAGEGVNSHNQLDWSRIGAGWKFRFLDDRLEVVPEAEFALFNFGYSLSGRSESVIRDYVKGAARLGVETTYNFSRFVSLSLDGGGSLPLPNTPQIAVLAGRVNFRLLSSSHRVNPKLFVGGGMEWIDYQDDQRLPNHIKAEIGPFIGGGLMLGF